MEPPSRRSARLASLEDNRGTLAMSTTVAPIPPLLEPSHPMSKYMQYIQRTTIHQCFTPNPCYSQLQTTQSLPTYYFSGRDSAIDGDTSEDLKDEASTDREELDDFLRWPPEMCIALEKPRRKRYKRATTTAKEDKEGREGLGSALQPGLGEGDGVSGGGLGWVGVGGRTWLGVFWPSYFDHEVGPSAPYGMDWPNIMHGGDDVGLYGGSSPRTIPLKRRECRVQEEFPELSVGSLNDIFHYKCDDGDDATTRTMGSEAVKQAYRDETWSKIVSHMILNLENLLVEGVHKDSLLTCQQFYNCLSFFGHSISYAKLSLRQTVMPQSLWMHKGIQGGGGKMGDFDHSRIESVFGYLHVYGDEKATELQDLLEESGNSFSLSNHCKHCD